MKYVTILICVLVIAYLFVRISNASRNTRRSDLKSELTSNDDAGPMTWLGTSGAESSGHSSSHHATGHADCIHGGDHGGGGNFGGGDCGGGGDGGGGGD